MFKPTADHESVATETLSTKFMNLLFGRSRHALHPSSACASRIGGRKENQDRCFLNDNAAVYLVVDGMGGHRGGAFASQIAIDAIGERLAAACENHPTHKSLDRALHDALKQAHQELVTFANEYPEFSRMGCTLAVAAIVGDRVFYTHIGDSRVYLIHKGRIKRLTRDETLLEALKSAQLFAKDDSVNHRWRHVVTNSLNTKGWDHEPHWSELKLSDGDQILLTSDGLTDELSDEEIAHQVRHSESPEQCVRSLIQEALDRNAKDNVSCVVTKMQRESV